MKLSPRTLALAVVASSLLVAAGLSEGAIRVLACHGNRVAIDIALLDPSGVKVVPHGKFGYRQRPGAVFDYAGGKRATANSDGFRGPVVARIKPNGTLRILVLGGSTSHGFGVNDDETIDTYLRQKMNVGVSTPTEALNLAFDGYDAYQDWQRLLTDGLPRNPDVIIVNSGINDVRNARFAPPLGDPDPRTLLWDDDMRRLRREMVTGPTPWTRLKHWLYLARLPGYVRTLAAQKKEVSKPIRSYPEAADNFERNINRIAAIGRQLGALVILSTPPSVITDPNAPSNMQPRSYWLADRASTQAYRDTLDGRLRAVAARLSANGQRVVYVAHRLDPKMFLDDCHLTPEGNRAMAGDFAAAIDSVFPRR